MFKGLPNIFEFNIFIYLFIHFPLLKLQFYYYISDFHHVFQVSRLIGKNRRKMKAAEQVENSLMMFTETELFYMRQVIWL